MGDSQNGISYPSASTTPDCLTCTQGKDETFGTRVSPFFPLERDHLHGNQTNTQNIENGSSDSVYAENSRSSSSNASAKDKNNSQQRVENDSDDCMIIEEVKPASGLHSCLDGTFVKNHSTDKFVTPVRKRKGRPPSSLKRKTNSGGVRKLSKTLPLEQETFQEKMKAIPVHSLESHSGKESSKFSMGKEKVNVAVVNMSPKVILHDVLPLTLGMPMWQPRVMLQRLSVVQEHQEEDPALESTDPVSFSFLQRKDPFSTFADQSEKLYTCPNCALVFTRPSKYKRHLCSHLINYNAYECKHCIMGFSSSWELYSHKKTHTFTETYKCEECARLFYHFGSLKRHQLTHLQKPPYKCPICEATFSTVDKRSRHIVNHVIDCVLCDRTFHTYPQFCNHIEKVHRSNNKDKNPQSVPLVELNEIMSLHPEITSLEAIDPNDVFEEKKVLICFVCEQGFSSKRVLFDHVLAHRVFLCSHCPKFFGTQADLNYHVHRIHRKDCAIDAKPDPTLAMEGKKNKRKKNKRKKNRRNKNKRKKNKKINKNKRKKNQKRKKNKKKKLKLVVSYIKNIQDNTTKSLQMERDAPFTQNMLDSILSTQSK